MGFQIADQLRPFLLAVLLGLGAGLWYDLLRAVRLRLPRLTGAADLLYCLTAGTALFLFVLRQAEGQLRGFVLLGAGGGCILFFTLFSAALRPVWEFWLDGGAEFLHLLAWPFRKAAVPCKKIVRQTKKFFYFCEKYATIKCEIFGARGKGGQPHDKERKSPRKEKIRRSADPHRDSSASRRPRLAAVQPRRSRTARPGRWKP